MAEVTQQEQQSLSGWKKCTLTTVEAACLLSVASVIAMDVAVATDYIKFTKCVGEEGLEWLFCVTTSVFSAFLRLCISICLYAGFRKMRNDSERITQYFNLGMPYHVALVFSVFLPSIMNLYAVGILSHPVVSFIIDFLPMLMVNCLFLIVMMGSPILALATLAVLVITLVLLIDKLQVWPSLGGDDILVFRIFFVVSSFAYVLLSILSFLGVYEDVNDDYGLNVLLQINYEFNWAGIFPKPSADIKTSYLDLRLAQGILFFRFLTIAVGFLGLDDLLTYGYIKDMTAFILFATNGMTFYSFFPGLRRMLTYTLYDIPIGVNSWFWYFGPICVHLVAQVIITLLVSCLLEEPDLVREKACFAVDKLMGIFTCIQHCCISTKASCLSLFSKSANDTESSHASVMTGLRSAESVITTPRSSRNCCASLFSCCSSRQRYRRASDVTVLTGMRSEEGFDPEYGDGAGLALTKAQ